ncbi:hypothetical protein [Acinetobacter radioresistens]|uniref:hypothetical protein n=1 Tax=Acinetobacter radioresistens TaxID=40216 RepID=UPI002004E487|nr:hypothetical protein [Acinetobacter radioresistens]MCK4081797.1 hypothetical protein [Acinetobacter radioresistens]MCU4607618.1 hypothetical protein [Acinetobacter radioresistens]HAV5332165.1 hypothetical protein [Acinetobacter baumannii]
MARIPMGNFGNVTPQAQQGRVLDNGAGQVAQAVGQLAQVGQQVSLKKHNEQLKIQEEKEQYQFNIEASKYGAEYQDYITETKQKLATGELDESLAKAYLRQRADEMNEAYSQRLPEHHREKFNYYSEKMYNDSQAFIKPLAYETQRRTINADFEQVGEATLKIENREQAFALYQDTVNRNPVLTPEQRTESIQKWNERRDLSDGKGVLGSLEEQQDIKALQELHKNVDTVFPHMKVETRDAYKSNIESAISRIQKGQEIRNKELDKEHAQLTKDFVADAYTGYPLSESLVNQTLEAVKGTKYEAQVREAIGLNKDAQKFRDASPIEQERSIARLTAELENSPQEDATALQKKLDVFKSIAATSKQRANDDPVAQVQSQTGHKLYTVTPEQIGSGQIDFKKAQVTTELLAEQKKANGDVGSLIQWNKSERTAFKDRYFEATPKQQRAMLSDLTKMAGKNKEAQKEYFSLIGGDKNAYDYMGIAKLNQLDVTLHNTNIRAAEVALEGKQILNQGQASVLGAEKEFHNAIQSEFGNATAIGTNEHRAYQNLAYSIYLGLAKRGENIIKRDDKGNPIINKEMAKQAFDIATGGTYKQKLGKNTNYIFMPYGFTQTSFEDHIQNHFRTQYRKETGFLPPDEDILKTHVVQPVPNATGWFMFLQPNGKVMKNPKTAKPYIMRIWK